MTAIRVWNDPVVWRIKHSGRLILNDDHLVELDHVRVTVAGQLL